MKTHIIVFGGTTLVGKTTHGKRLAQFINATYISTGDIARSLMDDKTKNLFKDGRMSPHDEIIRTTVYKKIAEKPTKFVILDGFPRMPLHYIDLRNWMASQAREFELHLVMIDISEGVMKERSNQRSRDDFDGWEVAQKRHATYKKETEAIMILLQREYDSYHIDINHTIDEDKVQNMIRDWAQDRGWC